MNFNDIIKEELNTKMVNQELAGLASIKKQIDNVIAQNPILGKQLSGPVAEIDKKLNGLKYAVTEYEKKKTDSKTGVGTQRAIQKPAQPSPVTPPSTEQATTPDVKQAVPASSTQTKI